MTRIVWTLLFIGLYHGTWAQTKITSDSMKQIEWQNYSVGVNGLTSELWASAYHPLIQYYIPISLLAKINYPILSYRASFTYYKDDLHFDTRPYSFDGASWGNYRSHNYFMKMGIERHVKLWNNLYWYPAMDVAISYRNGVSINNGESTGWGFFTSKHRTDYNGFGLGIVPSTGLILSVHDRIDLQYELGASLFAYYYHRKIESEHSSSPGLVKTTDTVLGTSAILRPVQMIAISYKFGFK